MQGVLRHIGSVHSHEADFKLTCGIDGCPRTYSNFRSFQKHIRRVHVAALDENAETTSQPTSQHHADEYDVASEASGHTQLSLKRNSALFLLKTKEKGRVSQLLLDELVSDLTTFIQDRILKVKQGVDLIIKNSCPEMSIETKDAIERCFNKEEITKPFAGLESGYMQKKYFKEEMNMLVCHIIGFTSTCMYNLRTSLIIVIVCHHLSYDHYLQEPVERNLGQTLRQKKVKGQARMKLCSDCAYDVPLLMSLKNLLSNKDILEDVRMLLQRRCCLRPGLLCCTLSPTTNGGAQCLLFLHCSIIIVFFTKLLSYLQT